mmetsp:Transcript_26396/g.40515  ORF Transcript_26396/g.40515 Transcript_26396/m.40515 type:complete len:674 (+) Transcript_26396:166-2187(+)|eukprot:CAMPEP_0195306502 /NCGR_PEP_ID=MMETSP0707-20130614/37232_1 /TAXON_ID=33640 /ORGANISM="Asterionellopsis glacialis, Strain CCMP134" /LENGTH=673 /DNA_ID=CAMNT_0040370721 /DNA_START=79 /DNA_END=2100 /DNA_ORIENTATION=-
MSSHTLGARPSEGRRAMLKEADAEMGNGKGVPLVSNFFPIERYYDAADKVLASFQQAYNEKRLDDAYVYGKRFATFSMDALPQHAYYRLPKNSKWRKKNGKDMSKIIMQLEQVAKWMDEEEAIKIKQQKEMERRIQKQKEEERKRMMALHAKIENQRKHHHPSKKGSSQGDQAENGGVALSAMEKLNMMSKMMDQPKPATTTTSNNGSQQQFDEAGNSSSSSLQEFMQQQQQQSGRIDNGMMHQAQNDPAFVFNSLPPPTVPKHEDPAFAGFPSSTIPLPPPIPPPLSSMQPSPPGAHLPKPIAPPPPDPPSASSLPSPPPPPRPTAPAPTAPAPTAPPPPSHKGSFPPPPSYDQLLHQTQETPQEKLARMKSLYPSESNSSTANGVQPPPPSFTAAAAGGAVARPGSLHPPDQVRYKEERPVRKERLSIRKMRDKYTHEYQMHRQSKKIQVFGLNTYQGRYNGSTNGCTVISPLVVANHLRSSHAVSDRTIEDVIDGQCISILRDIRSKLQLEGAALIIPSDVHDYMVDHKILKQEQFVGATGGNIIDKQHMIDFLKLLESGEKGEHKNKRSGAALFFREHVISMVKVPMGGGQFAYDLVDSLPSSSGQLSGKMGATRTRCQDLKSLFVCLRWYACKKFSESNCTYIDRNEWDESMADFDPRVFQSFVWADC